LVAFSPTSLDEPALIGEDDQLRAVTQTELGEQTGVVRLHGGGSDEQLG